MVVAFIAMGILKKCCVVEKVVSLVLDVLTLTGL